jgi:hypothetical protein
VLIALDQKGEKIKQGLFETELLPASWCQSSNEHGHMFFLIVFTGAQSILSSPFMPSSALREQEA